MKKKLILLSIIIFPSLIYFMFELTQANFKKMPYFGPKTVNEKGDTVYWRVPKLAFYSNVFTKEIREIDSLTGSEMVLKTFSADSVLLDTINNPVYAILFINEDLRTEGYKLAGLYDYIKYKTKDISQVPVFIVSDFDKAIGQKQSEHLNGEFDSLKINLSNFHPALVSYGAERTKFLSNTYFKQKPIHVFDYFMVLVDKKRHIRGYYDPTYNAEVKRMIDEYKHLKIRDEYAETLKQNDIKQDK